MSQTNYEHLNRYGIDAADVIDANQENLPSYGDNIKVRELPSKDSVRIESFIFIFNFTKGNYIRITNIKGKNGQVIKCVSRLIVPKDILFEYDNVINEISMRI